MDRKRLAQETVEALERGTYETPGGAVVNFAPLLKGCIAGTRCYDPEALADIREQVLSQPAARTSTTFEVVHETTLQGCARLVESGQYQRIGALNFASAKHPGGGFLSGAQAQEESLARSSGLYRSLLQCPAYYAFHRAQGTCLYSDRMIYSPGCPVLRKDDGSWLEQPFVIDFITSPAPNAGAIRQHEPHHIARILPVLQERSSKLLALAIYHGCDALVLGAWGCGVFRNDPRLVASVFWAHLHPTGPYWGRLPRVVFAVFDSSRTQDTYQAFARQFAALS